MSTLRPTVRPAVSAATRATYGLYQSEIVLVDALNKRYLGTFTRNGTATYFDANGVLQTAAANVPRWGYDPATDTLSGLLLERQSTNLLSYSSDFSQWTSSGPTVQQGGTALNGSPAWEMITTTTGNAYQGISLSASATTGYITYTAYAKPLGSTQYYLQLRPSGLGNGKAYANFDLSTGAVAGTGGTEYVSSSIEQLSSGYYRCTMVANHAIAPSGFYIYISNSASLEANTFAGDGSSGFYLSGAQWEQASSPRSYIPTNGSPVTRAAGSLSIPTTGMNTSVGSFILSGIANDLTGVIFNGSNAFEYYKTGFLVQCGGTNPSLSNLISAGTPFKVGFAYDNPNLTVTLASNTQITKSTSSTWDLGKSILVEPKSTYIKSLIYYPYAMTASQLQAATA